MDSATARGDDHVAPWSSETAIQMSKGMRFAAITTGGVPQVAPPSNDELKAIVLAAMSFHAAYTCPCGPVVTVTPMALPAPLGLSMRVVVKLRPWSRERARRIPPLEEPPSAASQPM